jgi:hypothetical protein
MNKLDTQHPSLTYPPEVQSEFSVPQPVEDNISLHANLAPAGRLLILIPANIDYALATRRIWKLAMTTGMPIQLIGLCKDPSEEPSLRRGLVTMAALIRDGKVCAEAKVELGTSWVDILKHNVQSGDMIVCFAEQRAGLWQRPLSEILQSSLKEPVYILSGLIPQDASRANWLSQIMVWGGSIGIIVGSAFLQIQITSLSQNWAQTVLLILSVIAETWLIGAGIVYLVNPFHHNLLEISMLPIILKLIASASIRDPGQTHVPTGPASLEIVMPSFFQ